MKLSATQFGVLYTLREHGPQDVVEVFRVPAIDGSRKAKIEGFLLTAATLDRLERSGMVSVDRGETYHLKNAVGKPGLMRRKLRIAITEAGRDALSTDEVL